MKREYHIENTIGIKFVLQGVTYTTQENINWEASDSDYMVSPKVSCVADDPEIMWGADDENADWFPPVICWESMTKEELEAWIDAGDWQDKIEGVLKVEKEQ